LPADLRLANERPVWVFGTDVPPWDGPTVELNLRFGKDGWLSLSYGHPTISRGCDAGPKLRPVRVGPYEGLLYALNREPGRNAEIAWPTTPRKATGRYELSGSFSGAEILRLARSMRPVPGLQPDGMSPGC
jgi:hypothetical protein